MKSGEHAEKFKLMRTPLGWAGVALSGKGITAVVLPRTSRAAVERELGKSSCRSGATDFCDERLLAKAVRQVEEYFSGKTASFDLPLDLRYATPFQRAVWKAAAKIPYGETRSYGWIAKKIGKPAAARAVGQAMGANPVPLLVP